MPRGKGGVNWTGTPEQMGLIDLLQKAVNEYNARAVTVAKQQLYWGHGMRTGTLRRDIQMQTATKDGKRIVGAFGTNVFYSLFVHEPGKGERAGWKGIPFLKIAFNAVKPMAQAIVAHWTSQAKVLK